MLCAMMAMATVLGCAKEAAEAPAATEAPKTGATRFTAENEIYTYEPIDPAKTTLVVASTGNIFLEPFSRLFEEKNPDIQIVQLDITGGDDPVRPVVDWVTHGMAPDVMFTPTGIFPDEVTVAYFEDLSAHPVVANYQAEALNRSAVDANIYWLPGPSKVDCMLYNKTLFKQYGWKVPKTFDEFVEVCLQIREDTNGEVQPWNPNAKYGMELLRVMEGFVYAEVFGGLENRTWYREFIQGRSTFKGHMEPYYAALQTLIDNNLLLEEHFSYSATTRGKEFEAGKIAMYNYPVSIIDSDRFVFDFMPFPTTQGEEGFVCDTVNCLIGVPKKEHTDAEREAIDRFLAFLSSAEGQQAFIGKLLMFSNVKGVPLNRAEHLAALQPAIEQGRMFELMDFRGPPGAPQFGMHTDALALLKGEKTVAECIAAVDAQPYPLAGAAAKAAPEVIATAAQDFTILETSAYLADMYREATGADIGLINNCHAYRGNLMRIFKGDLTAAHVQTLKPRSFANGSTLVKVSMTGRQLMDALNDPVGNEDISNTVYAFSGLTCTVAPWKPLGEKVLSVTLSDGTAIDPDKLYTVACWDGTVKEPYITEVTETYEGTFEQHLTKKLKAEGSIAPANDGRITLVWE